MQRNRSLQHLFFIATFLLILTMSFYTVQSINPIQQKIITVDPNGNGNYTTIQDAITHASPTDIIQIQPGIYHEYALSIDKKIDLIGTDSTTCIINCDENQGFIIHSSYVTISHLQITNSRESAISIQRGSNGCNISHCDIRDLINGNGVDILSSYNTISHCTIDGITRTGQALKVQGTYNTIDNCTLQQFSNGILIISHATNNTIMNCNIFDNENAIDIRMNSNANHITNCNIYSNLQGIKIWQNSHNNTISQNNLFKNDNNAIDEGTNQWDNGSQGNYWDLYQGIDTNHDGIGDTPFIISDQSSDRFPSTTMLLANVIIAPTDITQTTSTADPTPTFTWNPVIYSKGISGYAIKIDTGEEIIIQTPNWTSPTNLTNGVHLLVIRALGADGLSSVSRTLKFTIDTNFNDLDHDGWSDEEEVLYGSDPGNLENYPLDTDGDHLPDTVDIDDDNDGYPDEVEFSYGTNLLDKTSYPEDTDGDKVPDENSPDGKYQGDIDRDDDGLPNTVENQLGSNPTNSTDAQKIYLGGTPVFLVDVSQDGIYDILYESTSETIHAVEYTDGTYRIDMDGDGSSDYLYRTADGSVTSSHESFIASPLFFLLIGIILILLAIGIILFVKTGSDISKKLRKFRKKPLPSVSTIDSETQNMVLETRTLLDHIQQDVITYIKILNQIEKQTPLAGLKLEDQQLLVINTGTQKIKDHDELQHQKQPLPTSQSRIDDVEAEIDKLFETLNGKNT